MRVNEKFPKWMSSGGSSDQAYTGLISNLIYPYFDTPDKPVFQIPYSSEVFPSYTYGTPATWLTSLDVMFATRYGERHLVKWLSDMALHNNSAQSLTAEQKENTRTIAQMINLRYGDKWNHIAEVLAKEYDPLENYNRDETSSYQNSQVGDTKDTKSYGQKFNDSGTLTADARESERDIQGNYKDSDSTTVTEENGKEKMVLEKVSGFDSSDSSAGIEDAPGVPSTYQHIVEQPLDNDGYVVSHCGGIEREYGSSSKPYKEITKEKGSEAYKHEINTGDFGWTLSNVHGNIGVKDNMQMLQSEIDVRKANILYDIILRDIADFICLSIY